MSKRELQLCVYCAAKMEEMVRAAGRQQPRMGVCSCCGKQTVVQAFQREKRARG